MHIYVHIHIHIHAYDMPVYTHTYIIKHNEHIVEIQYILFNSVPRLKQSMI